jgi:hypothetical protein
MPIKYNVNPKFFICTNAACSQGEPHWAKTGKKTNIVCRWCGQKTVRETKSEPRR